MSEGSAPKRHFTFVVWAFNDGVGFRYELPDQPGLTDYEIFLPAGESYTAEVYADGPGADWRTNPLPVAISKRVVSSKTRLKIGMAPGGGQATCMAR